MCTVQCITTIKYKYYITIGPWSWCDPIPCYILSPVDRWCPRHIISSFPCHRVAPRPGRRLATKTTTTATSQNKSVKVPHRQRTKKVIRRLSTRSYREYSSARSSSLSPSRYCIILWCLIDRQCRTIAQPNDFLPFWMLASLSTVT